jgi:hypothetical protein
MCQHKILKYYDVCKFKMLKPLQCLVCNVVVNSYRCWESAAYGILATKVFDKVPFIRLNTTYRSSTIVCYYTLQNISAVQISHRQVDVG